MRTHVSHVTGDGRTEASTGNPVRAAGAGDAWCADAIADAGAAPDAGPAPDTVVPALMDRTPGWHRLYSDKLAVIHVRDAGNSAAPCRQRVAN